jgi:hypothetical protein
MIKDTISMVLTAKELSTYVENKIRILNDKLEKAEYILKNQRLSFTTREFFAIDCGSYKTAIRKEETFLKLLQKFPKNKHELFLDDIEYYGILEINTEAPPNVGC